MRGADTLFVFAILICSACAHRSSPPPWTEKAFAEKVLRFKGKSVWDVIDKYGYPQREFINPDGFKVYEYRSQDVLQTPLYAYTHTAPYPFAAHTQIYGGETIVYSCDLWFELTKDAKQVEKVRWMGSGCRAPEEISQKPPQ